MEYEGVIEIRDTMIATKLGIQHIIFVLASIAMVKAILVCRSGEVRVHSIESLAAMPRLCILRIAMSEVTVRDARNIHASMTEIS